MGVFILGFECPRCGAKPHKQCAKLPGREHYADRMRGRHCDCERCLNQPVIVLWHAELRNELEKMTEQQKQDWTRAYNRKFIDEHNAKVTRWQQQN